MARKDVTAIVSGAGWIAGFADKLVRALRERKVSDEQIHQLVTDDGDVPVGKIADALVAIMEGAKNVFRLTLDYAHSVEEMVAAGKYNWTNSDITSKNFPTTQKGTAEVAIELVHLNRRVSSDNALCELDARGLRPATLPELLAFGAEYPEKQREFPIIALGSVWRNPHGYRTVAYLVRYGSKRDLRLHWFDNEWFSHYRFAAVRK
ncbi:MAG: hypothetical protein HY435_02570 [Candidatus Liptonbacteria bacterium]|nr:hypothetical protein [Candidatus Liptonbacteria bacterium]